jgi:AraC-like DNA-binding protein
MRIARVERRWRVLGFGHVVHDCLENLALVQGYRVNGICRELGLSESYLRELFLRDVGLGPKEWMQWERMVVARRMLVWGMEPGEVTERLGYAHPNSFRTAFRQFHGMCPSRFVDTRKEALGIDA